MLNAVVGGDAQQWIVYTGHAGESVSNGDDINSDAVAATTGDDWSEVALTIQLRK